MPELTLNDPLSGAEIKSIILQAIEKRLNGDCTLADGLAYAGFTAKFDMKVSFLRSLTQPTTVWGNAGKSAEEPAEPAGETTVEVAYTSPSPNIARQDNNLPIPVMVSTPNGPVRKRVHIEKAKQ